MKKKTRRIAAAALAAVTCVSLGACGSGASANQPSAAVTPGVYNGPKVTVTFWNGFTGGNQPVLLPKLVDQFNAEHANIEIKNVPIEWADIAAKMPLAVKNGNGPDVAVAHGSDVATYAAQGLLIKADSIIKDLGYTEDDFPAGLMKAGNYGGAQYGVPWSVTPLGLFVNNDVLKQAGLDTKNLPTDKASYEKYLDTLKDKGVQGEWVDGFEFTGLYEFEALLWQYGGQLFNEDVSKSTFNSDAGVQALTWMADHVAKGYSPKNVAQDADFNALVSGKTAFNWNGVWQTTNTALEKVNWTSIPVPQIGTQKATWSSSTHWMFMNNKNQDPNKTQAAAVFVKWMNEHSKIWASSGELPADNAVRNDPSLVKDYPTLAPFIESLNYAHFETAAPGIGGTTSLLTTAVNEAVLGKKSPKQALDDAAAQADKVLAQNKAQYGG